jgi:hypothetical protein
MKKVVVFISVLLFAGLVNAKMDLPEINKKIVSYLNTVLGEQVDRGECWDLAKGALNASGAKFNPVDKKSVYDFGKIMDPEKNEIFPGDIVQFENVKVSYQKGNSIFTEEMPHHTAIVFKVYEKGSYQLAHQNTSFSGRKVGTSDFNLANVNNGKITFYRPVAP